jgi:Flp pilus assembly pilin Flp
MGELSSRLPQRGILLRPIRGDHRRHIAIGVRRLRQQIPEEFSVVVARRTSIALGAETGQTMSEYAVALTVISVTVLLALGLLASVVTGHLNDVANLIP